MLKIILLSITTIGIIGQYFLEHIVKVKAKKKKAGLALVFVSILSLIGSFVSEQIDSEGLTLDIDSLRISSDTMKSKLSTSEQELTSLGRAFSNLQSQNDSLLTSNEVLRLLLESTKEDVGVLTTRTIEGFSQNQKRIDAIRVAEGSRLIPEEEKKEMISLLSRRKGKVHFELSMEGGGALKFAQQLKDVFLASGWHVTNKYDYFVNNPPLDGLQVVIKKGDRVPVGLEEVVRAIKVTGVKYELYYVPESDKRLEEYIYLVIGAL